MSELVDLGDIQGDLPSPALAPIDELLAPSWAAEPCLLGVDEAGRGPVLGPMVYGIAYAPLRCKDAIAKRSFADSKTLSEDKRDKLYSEIEQDVDMGFAADSISAAEISSQMLRSEKVSLNEIAMASTVRLIKQTIVLGVNVREVYCDTVGDPTRWRQRLESAFPGIQFQVTPKADALFPIVSAASIVAKVTRDRSMKSWTDNQRQTANTLPMGSGYPADPITVAWMKGNMDSIFGYPEVVRFSWSTAAKILQEAAAPIEWEADEDLLNGQQRLTTGPKRKRGGIQDLTRHAFFRSRRLQQVDLF